MAIMVVNNKVSVRKAELRDKSRLANLIHFENFVHRHLDWRSPLEWIGTQPFLISEVDNQMVGALACPPDPPGIAWIRLFAVSSLLPLGEGWDHLLHEIKEYFYNEKPTRDSTRLLAIPLQAWFKSLLQKSNFIHIRDVVIMVWEKRVDLPSPENEINIRRMEKSDLTSIYDIDCSAFSEEWRNSVDSIEEAFRQASLATVAVHDQKIVGYQISTGGSHSGHLARLAVRPDVQKKGIGYSLVYDLLSQFSRRGISRVTVNTQQDNIGSLKLYEKARFTQTGEVFPVFQYEREN